MNTFNQVQQQAVDTLNATLKGAQPRPDQILKGIAALCDSMEIDRKIKIDKGNTLTARDKQVRKALPKARNEIGRKSPKDQALNRIMDNIQRLQKMAPKATDLHGQLWAVYATIEALHIDDDHWLIADLPQPMPESGALTRKYYIDDSGKVQRHADTRSLLEIHATRADKDCNATRGGHFHGMQSGYCDAEQEYKQSEYNATDHSWNDIS